MYRFIVVFGIIGGIGDHMLIYFDLFSPSPHVAIAPRPKSIKGLILPQFWVARRNCSTCHAYPTNSHQCPATLQPKIGQIRLSCLLLWWPKEQGMKTFSVKIFITTCERLFLFLGQVGIRLLQSQEFLKYHWWWNIWCGCSSTNSASIVEDLTTYSLKPHWGMWSLNMQKSIQK